MAAIADLSDLVNRATGGSSGTPETISFFKDPRIGGSGAAATVAGRWTSLWSYNGQPGGASAAPGAVAIPVNTTEGALKQTDPGGGREKWMTGVAASSLNAGVLVLYDRLLHVSGLDGTVTTAQAVQGGTAGARTPALTRYTDGVGNVLLVEVYTQIGASGTTATITYDDQDNTESTTPAFVIGGTGFREAERLLWVPLASGDSAVRGVKEIDLLATTGTAGNFGVTVAHPLAYINIPASAMLGTVDFVQGIIPEIQTDACLALMWQANSTTAPQVFGSITTVEA